MEIFRNAKDKNSIIYLETGTGKTVISIMLMNYYLKKFEFKKKVSILLDLILNHYHPAGGVTIEWNFAKNALDSAQLPIHYGG